jgi:hypothetical protein
MEAIVEKKKTENDAEIEQLVVISGIAAEISKMARKATELSGTTRWTGPNNTSNRRAALQGLDKMVEALAEKIDSLL